MCGLKVGKSLGLCEIILLGKCAVENEFGKNDFLKNGAQTGLNWVMTSAKNSVMELEICKKKKCR